MNVERLLAGRLAAGFAAVAGEPVDPAVRRSARADFQSDGALALGRRLGRPPRDVAAEAMRHALLDDVCQTAKVSGPGFINVTVADPALGAWLSAMAVDERLGVQSANAPETVTDAGQRSIAPWP